MTIRVSRYAWAASFVLALCIARSPELLAAEAEVLFEDDFSTLDPSFEVSDENLKISVEDHNLVFDSKKAKYGYTAIYQSAVYTDADITIRARLGDPEAEKGAELGLIFWALNYSEYYSVSITDSGTIGIFSTNGKRWVSPVSYRRNSALKTGADEWNELRVVTVGHWATVYINGKKLASIKGKPPEGGGLIGPYFYSGSDPSSARFSQMKVVAPTGPDAVVPEEKPTAPDVLYSDEFATLDPGWGSESGNLSVKDGKLLIKPNPEYGYHVFQGAVLVSDIDMTVKVSINDNDPNSYSAAGLVFWAQADDDFFILELNDSGMVGVYRLVKGRWLNPLPLKQPPTQAKVQPGAPVELRVVTSGKKAACYVNGVLLGTITGQPIKTDWQFGFYAENGKTQATGEFSSLMVRKPAVAAK